MSTPDTVVSSNQLCPKCGYDQTGTLATGQSRCAECGIEYDPNDLVQEHELPYIQARRILGRCAVLFGVVFFAVVIFGFDTFPGRTRCGCRPPTASYLRQQHAGMQYYAQDTGGQYPDHIARLIAQDYYSIRVFVENSAGNQTLASIAGLVDLQNMDWSENGLQHLESVVDAIDKTTGYYKVGDFWFAYLARATGRADIVVGWSNPYPGGDRHVIFDDGHVEELSLKSWRQAWKDDAKARGEIGLAPIEVIPP